jgi:hypothetical protein
MMQRQFVKVIGLILRVLRQIGISTSIGLVPTVALE